MYLDFSQIEFDAYGRPEVPVLELRTLSNEIIGPLAGVNALNFNIKLSEPSEISFDLPAKVNGMRNPMYERVCGYKLIYTKHYGVYVIMQPSLETNGISESTHITAYSIEKLLERKKFFIEEGTFNFWDPTAPADTLLGRMIEKAPDWSVGYVSPALIGRYRTFESYDDSLLDFAYNTAPEKYRCVFVFDPYAKTINVHDGDEELPVLPIYLDFNNLLESLDIEEITDDIRTALRPYGADELDIRNVNPIGSNWIYNLSHFIEKGDISGDLADKWGAWQKDIQNSQILYQGFTGLRASATARALTEQASLTDMQGELTDLMNRQSITIQALALETTEEGKAYQQELLDDINAQIELKKKAISEKTTLIAQILYESDGNLIGEIGYLGSTYIYTDDNSVAWALTLNDDGSYTVRNGGETSCRGSQYYISGAFISCGQYEGDIEADWLDPNGFAVTLSDEAFEPFRKHSDAYTVQLSNMVATLSITNYFTAEEYNALSQYFFEDDLTDETFIASEYTSATSGRSNVLDDAEIHIEGSVLVSVIMSEYADRQIITMSGGKMTIEANAPISADIVRGTVEIISPNSPAPEYVVSIHVGKHTVGDETNESGLLSITCNATSFVSDIVEKKEDEITSYEGAELTISGVDGSVYVTSNITEYQKYSVQRELYDHATSVLADLATPTYEFSVHSGNFIFAREFDAFRRQLQLGKGIYLRVGEQKVITPYIIELEFEFESQNSFALVFSNRFKRHDTVNTLKGMIEKGYSAGRSLDASRYTYNQAASQTLAVSEFMAASLNAAKNTILAAADQSVVIDGSGIRIGGDSPCQMRITGSMIAMTNDNWATASLAMGLFSTEESGQYFGINADVIGGKLTVSNSLIIESASDNGVVQFRVDSTGAWLNNSTFILQKDEGGKIIIDPKYGIVAGSELLFNTSGTTVTPSFIDEDGNIVFDEDGMPENSNFYLSIDNGNAYFRGTIRAGSGAVGGWTLENDYLYSGETDTFVALNASAENNALYAIWAGSEDPANAKFWVKRDGTCCIDGGTYSGVLSNTSIYSPTLYATTDTSSASLKFVDEVLTYSQGGTSRIKMSGDDGNNDTSVCIGSSSPVYVAKRINGSNHQAWFGNEDETCGILFDFTAKTYKLVGTQA